MSTRKNNELFGMTDLFFLIVSFTMFCSFGKVDQEAEQAEMPNQESEYERQYGHFMDTRTPAILNPTKSGIFPSALENHNPPVLGLEM